LRLLREGGIDRILVNLHHHADLVSGFLAGNSLAAGVTTTYESELLGTGGTLVQNRDFFGNAPILLAHGDNLTAFDVREFLEAHRTRPAGSEITMMTFTTPDPRSCGIVEITPDGMVTAFHEKVPDPPGNLANAAVYVLEPSVLDFIASLGKNTVDISTEVLPGYVGRMSTYHNAIYHRDIGTLESLLMAQFDFALAQGAVDTWSRLLHLHRADGALADRFLGILAAAIRKSRPEAGPER